MPIPKPKDISIGTAAPAWMLTYSDLVTQLLIFFVMLFALASALNEMQLIQIKKRIDQYVKANHLEKTISLDINEKGLVISLKEKMMFERGGAEIFPDAQEVLKNVARPLLLDLKGKPLRNRVSIEGHTCDLPIRTVQFPSNWELSTARATNVLRYLLEGLRFPPDRLTVGGYGEFQPLVANKSEEKRALNRRVDLVVHRIGVKRTRQQGAKTRSLRSW